MKVKKSSNPKEKSTDIICYTQPTDWEFSPMKLSFSEGFVGRYRGVEILEVHDDRVFIKHGKKVLVFNLDTIVELFRNA